MASSTNDEPAKAEEPQQQQQLSSKQLEMIERIKNHSAAAPATASSDACGSNEQPTVKAPLISPFPSAADIIKAPVLKRDGVGTGEYRHSATIAADAAREEEKVRRATEAAAAKEKIENEYVEVDGQIKKVYAPPEQLSVGEKQRREDGEQLARERKQVAERVVELQNSDAFLEKLYEQDKWFFGRCWKKMDRLQEEFMRDAHVRWAGELYLFDRTSAFFEVERKLINSKLHKAQNKVFKEVDPEALKSGRHDDICTDRYYRYRATNDWYIQARDAAQDYSTFMLDILQNIYDKNVIPAFDSMKAKNAALTKHELDAGVYTTYDELPVRFRTGRKDNRDREAAAHEDAMRAGRNKLMTDAGAERKRLSQYVEELKREVDRYEFERELDQSDNPAMINYQRKQEKKLKNIEKRTGTRMDTVAESEKSRRRREKREEGYLLNYRRLVRKGKVPETKSFQTWCRDTGKRLQKQFHLFQK